MSDRRITSAFLFVIPTEVEESLNISEFKNTETSRDVSHSTRFARSGHALNMAAAPLRNGCNVTLPLDMTEKQKRLLLFDIDGTLIHSGGAGVEALKVALKERFEIADDLHDIEIAGMTDSGIVISILKKHKIPTSAENVAAFLDSYVHFLSLELPRRKGKLLPGVLELLKRLKTRKHLVLGLLTGNVSRGAQLKLGHYGVWHFFEFGAFADDHHDRNELGAFARARAQEKHGREFSADEIDVIGDTPRDIACGKALGARTIAVATGTWSRQKLAEHDPDILIDDLSDVDRLINTLGW